MIALAIAGAYLLSDSSRHLGLGSRSKEVAYSEWTPFDGHLDLPPVLWTRVAGIRRRSVRVWGLQRMEVPSVHRGPSRSVTRLPVVTGGIRRSMENRAHIAADAVGSVRAEGLEPGATVIEIARPLERGHDRDRATR